MSSRRWNMLHSSSTRTDKTQFSSLAWRAARALFLLAAVVVLATLLVPQAMARDVSAIKSIDMRTGIVTAVEKTTGRSFQFTVHDQALLKTLRVGQPVYADFDSSKVSIDGIEPCCNIITKFGPVDSAKFGPVDSAIPCCNITGMDASGTVAA